MSDDSDKSGPKHSLKSALSARGIAPQKKFGQNFMLDTNFAFAVARDAQPGAGTLTIEVGPGTGCLTRAILDSDPQARVLAIEIDHGLAALLRETFASELESGRLTLLEGDALASKHELNPELVAAALEISARENRPRRTLCANLPYNAATPILANLAGDAQNVDVALAIATVQLELGERLFGAPGGSDYGALTAFMALRSKGAIIRRVGNEVFWPRPQVDSAVIRIEYLPFSAEAQPAPDRLRRREAETFQKFLQQLFSQRRKTLRATLKPRVIPPELGIAPEARAEDLAPEVLLKLFRNCATGSTRSER